MSEEKQPGRPLLDRRTLLRSGAAAALAAPLGVIGAQALPFRAATPGIDFSEFPICRTASDAPPIAGAPRKLKLSWNAGAVCLAPVPIAIEYGFFQKQNLDVELVNYSGSTDQLLEAIATGKSDAGLGMALRWLKPLEQGFDVKITAGVHGGCMRLLAGKSTGITKLEDLRGKTVAISDQASPSKNFFSIVLAKKGLDPVKDVEWRQYPMDLLALAVEKGEAHALADGDPRTWLWLKDGKLTEVATNLSGEYATRTCCVLAIRGSLIRDDRAVATALTRAVLEGGELVAHKPEDAAAVFAGYGGKGSVEELAAMLRSHTHHDHPVATELKTQIALYADELKLVNVIKLSTGSAKFAARVYADVLS